MLVTQILHNIQKNLSVPKNRTNSFGGYKYRSAEDIVDAVKALLPEGAIVTLDDELVMLGNRFYIKATAALRVGDGFLSATGWAREPEAKKGFDESQITGAASSYARKYALNGLFAIDDGVDADSQNSKPKPQKTPEEKLALASGFADLYLKELADIPAKDITILEHKHEEKLKSIHANYPVLSAKIKAANEQKIQEAADLLREFKP